MDHPLLLPEQLTPYLKSLRKRLGLSQAELGKTLGVGQARMADIENNPGSVSVDQMMKLLASLGARLLIRSSSGDAAPDVTRTARSGKPVTDLPAPGSADKPRSLGAGKPGKASGPRPSAPAVRRSTPKGSW